MDGRGDAIDDEAEGGIALNERPWPSIGAQIPLIDVNANPGNEMEHVLATLNDLIRAFNDQNQAQGNPTIQQQGKQKEPTTTATSSVYPGVVTGGSGTTYTMNVYINGLGSAATTVTVTQLQLTSGTIPAGTWALVAYVNGGYYMQVPVWL